MDIELLAIESVTPKTYRAICEALDSADHFRVVASSSLGSRLAAFFDLDMRLREGPRRIGLMIKHALAGFRVIDSASMLALWNRALLNGFELKVDIAGDRKYIFVFTRRSARKT